MAKNQLVFYATAGDLGSVLSTIEAEKPLQYTLMGLFEANKPQIYESYTNIPDFGRAPHPTAAANRSYLLSLRGTEVRVREVPQKAGGVLFGIDQSCNENAIVLRPAGRHGNNIIPAARICDGLPSFHAQIRFWRNIPVRHFLDLLVLEWLPQTRRFRVPGCDSPIARKRHSPQRLHSPQLL